MKRAIESYNQNTILAADLMGLTIAPFRLEARHYLSRRIEKVAKELFRVQVGLMMDSIAKKFEA